MDRSWAAKFDLKGHEGAAALSPNNIGQLSSRGRVRLESGGRGVVFYTTELFAPRALGFVVASGFDSSVRLGDSAIQIAFHREDRDRILAALQQVNDRRIPLIERGIFYPSLRAGPAGRWIDGRLATKAELLKDLVAFGPYVDLGPGEYRMRYRFRLFDCGQSAQLRIRLGVTSDFGRMLETTHYQLGDTLISEGGCTAQTGATFIVEQKLARALEFPLWNEGSAPFSIEEISLIKLHQPGL